MTQPSRERRGSCSLSRPASVARSSGIRGATPMGLQAALRRTSYSERRVVFTRESQPLSRSVITSPAIETINLRNEYGGTRVLHDLTLSVGQGEIFGFLGPNGAGKT